MLSEILIAIKKNLFLIFLIVLISFFSFQLGRISKIADEPIRIEKASIQEIFNNDSNLEITSESANIQSRGEERLDFRVVVSKNSNKYHFLWCSGAKRIKEENKIYFNSEKEAIVAGYSLAGNCSK
jgi:hypothetical protein